MRYRLRQFSTHALVPFLGLAIGALVFNGKTLGIVFGLGLGIAIQRWWWQRERHRVAQCIQQQNQSVAFIKLAALMAKVDGVVSTAEVAVFKKGISYHPKIKRLVGKLFDRATQRVEDGPQLALEASGLAPTPELLKLLYDIATADGTVHAHQHTLLRQVAKVWGVPDKELQQQLRNWGAHIAGEDILVDAFATLGLAAGATWQEVKTAYKKLIRQLHPDKLRGDDAHPQDIARAEQRLQEVTEAYQQISDNIGKN